MARLKVLLVEDDPDSRELLEELLSTELEIHAVENADEALACFRAEHWDALVTDQSLPGMAGTELAREVKRTAPHLPVILMSGYSEIRSAESCDLVMGKPLEPAKLASALQRLTTRAEGGESPSRPW